MKGNNVAKGLFPWWRFNEKLECEEDAVNDCSNVCANTQLCMLCGGSHGVHPKPQQREV